MTSLCLREAEGLGQLIQTGHRDIPSHTKACLVYKPRGAGQEGLITALGMVSNFEYWEYFEYSEYCLVLVFLGFFLSLSPLLIKMIITVNITISIAVFCFTLNKLFLS